MMRLPSLERRCASNPGWFTLQKLVARDWVQGSLWFVISRFDEAGVDPESDPAGFRALADRKTDELRRALQLGETVPVFVVSQDFAQMAGSERNPASAVWDEFREWDGTDRLSRALAELGSSNIDTLRTSAAQRFWRSQLAESLAGLRSEVVKYAEQKHFAKESLQHRMSWLAQLDVLKRSAEADLRGRVSETIGAVVDDQRCAHTTQLALKAGVDLWYATHERNVDKLRHDVDATTKVERRRPSWHQLEGLVHTVRDESDAKATAADNAEVFASVVSRISKAALTALTEYEKMSVPKSSGPVAGRSAAAVCHRVAVASAVVPVIGQLASIGEGLHRDKVNQGERERRREAAVAELNRVGERVTLIALRKFDPVIDATRQLIIDVTADQANMCDGLDNLVRELDVLIKSGEAILG
ncbi:hypothetical protein [Mycobacterium asiaticum]|uniref:hypothetical protein n=1 Tax=Mycobacterium asiaticum TaxID=1790 RepID=UPI0007EF84C8|nr:hypothetical protein [Mycobacterium asiaticum]OBI90584.1 hypothetical protein A5661_02920 [Mycobacterium asiaticum]